MLVAIAIDNLAPKPGRNRQEISLDLEKSIIKLPLFNRVRDIFQSIFGPQDIFHIPGQLAFASGMVKILKDEVYSSQQTANF